MKHKVEEIKLGNGIRGLLIDAPESRVMRYTISFRAGEYLCPVNKRETAHFLEHLMFKANAGYSDNQAFLVDMCKNGAYLNASTGLNDINYVADCAAFEWERVFKLLLLATTKPVFTEKHRVNEARVIQDELTSLMDRHMLTLSLAVTKEISGIDLTAQTGLDSLDNISIEDIESFYRRTHFARNCRFVVAGDLKNRRRSIENMMSGLSLPANRKGRLPNHVFSYKDIRRPVSFDHPAAGKFYFCIILARRRRFTFKERLCLALLEYILTGPGGVAGITSRINKQARSRGLSYGINCDNDNRPKSGIFHFDGSVEQANAAELIELVAEEARKIIKGDLKEEEIEAAKQQYLGIDARRETTSLSLINYYSGDYLHDDTFLDYDEDIRLIPSIDKKQILETFRSIVDERTWYLGLLGPEASKQAPELFQKASQIFPD